MMASLRLICVLALFCPSSAQGFIPQGFMDAFNPFGPSFSLQSMSDALSKSFANMAGMFNQAMNTAESHKVTIVRMDKIQQKSGQIEFIVDSRIAEFSVHVTGGGQLPTFHLKSPLDMPIQSFNLVMGLGTQKIMDVKKPSPGLWTLSYANGNGPWDLSIQADSKVDFDYVLEKLGTKGQDPVILDFNKDVVGGDNVTIIVGTSTETGCNADEAVIQRPNGDVLEKLKLIANEAEENYNASFIVPKESFYVAFRGMCGGIRYKILEGFQRVRPVLIQPTTISFEVASPASFHAKVAQGSKNIVEFNLVNKGPSAMFDFVLDDTQGFVQTHRRSFFMEHGKKTKLQFDLIVPSDATVDAVSMLLLKAKFRGVEAKLLEVPLTVVSKPVSDSAEKASSSESPSESVAPEYLRTPAPEVPYQDKEPEQETSEPINIELAENTKQPAKNLRKPELFKKAPLFGDLSMKTSGPSCSVVSSSLNKSCSALGWYSSCDKGTWSAQFQVSGSGIVVDFDEVGGQVKWKVVDPTLLTSGANGNLTVLAVGSCCVSSAKLTVSAKPGKTAFCVLSNESARRRPAVRTSILSQQQLIIILATATACVLFALLAKLIWWSAMKRKEKARLVEKGNLGIGDQP